MKTIRFTFSSLAFVLLAVGCSDDVTTQKPAASAGDEVQFGALLPGKDSRTVYGNETSTGFPIYWVNGDLVKVASPQCLAGRNVAEYKVSVTSETQNFADQMVKTGDYGVQWGEKAEAYFYSIYPSSEATELNIDGDNVTAKLHVDPIQTSNTSTRTDGSFYAEPAAMSNVVMYAKSYARNTDENVDLSYVPFSTVLEFSMSTPEGTEAGRQDTLSIQMLTLTAPKTTIAGDFNFVFPDNVTNDASVTKGTPKVTALTGGSNSISMHLTDANGKYIVLKPTANKLTAKMCLMPISGVTSLEGWTVDVRTNSGTFSKTLGATDAKGNSTELVAGKVHKITLPELSYATKQWEYTLENGAWYAGTTESYQNSDAQGTKGIAALYNKGIRAFGVECRSWSKNAWSNPSRLCVSGSGRPGTTGDGYVDPVLGSATKISDVIKAIANAINKEENKEEFAVLVLSYADGGSNGGHRDSDHAYFLAGIANEISQSGATNIYTGPLDANTTIEDVKGQLIIKVNVDEKIKLGNYTSMNALISYTPFLSQIGRMYYAHPCYSDMSWSSWADTNKTYGLVSTLQNASGNSDKFIWVFSSANRTHTDGLTTGDTDLNPSITAETMNKLDIPTYAERKEALGAMMNFSKQIYAASTHNVWFYFNCGGTQAFNYSHEDKEYSSIKYPSPTEFATEMNKWLLNQINAKTDASPLGIVMFNQCTNASYNGPAIVKAIIEMNSKFYLKHAGVSGGTSTGGTTTNKAQNNAILTSGGNAF